MTRQARGFSMVELMVALTLALVVTGGVLAVFVGSRSAAQNTSGVQAVADGGRFALNFIRSSVRSAGYMACNTASRQLNLLNAGPTPLYFNFTQPLGGYEAANTGVGTSYAAVASPVTPDTNASDWTGNLDAALVGKVLQNTDVLVVRSSMPQAQSVYVTSIVDGASTFTVNTSAGLASGQLAAISDCAKSAIMQISSITSGANATIGHGLSGNPGNNVAAFPVSFGVGSQVTPVNTVVYYIGRGADGDGALFAYNLNASNTFTAREMVSNIEAMQILYGLDTNGTQSVSQYVTANQVTDFNQVMSIKVAILAASPLNAVSRPAAPATYNLLGTTVTAPLDTRFRQVFDATIAVRNSVT